MLPVIAYPFSQFVEHCKPHTTDCSEVLTFLQSRHTKASPDFLSSVEFRNTLGRCLTKAQASTAKTFVYINELCTVLKQHSTKRRTTAHTLPPAEEKTQKRTDGEAEGGSPAEVTPSTSGAQDEHGNEGQEEKKTKRASRRQVFTKIIISVCFFFFYVFGAKHSYRLSLPS